MNIHEEDLLNELGIECLQKEDFEGAFKYWQEAARLGHREAKYHLANLYYYGEGVNVDYVKATALFKEVAECEGSEKDLDIANSRFNLANAYYKGEGIEADEEKAFYWYEKAAELNQPSACFNVGRLYFTGEVYGQDYDKAYRYLIVPAKAGMAMAQYMIGVLYFLGKGCNKDVEEAKRWLNEAASQGDSNAIQTLKNLTEVEENEERLQEEKEKRIEEYKKYFKDVVEYDDPMELADMEVVDMDNISIVLDREEYDILLDEINMEEYSQEELFEAALNGNRKAQYLYGMSIIDEDPEGAIKHFSLSAAKGYGKAMFTLGVCNLNGFGVLRDTTKGMIYMAKAAKAKDREALYFIANYYKEEKSFEKMANIYHILADELNDIEAAANLGYCYFTGSEINQDFSKSYYYLNKAHEEGITDMVSTQLGLMYLFGNGVTRDKDKALSLLNEGVDSGEPNAMCYLGEMYLTGSGVDADVNKAKEYYKMASELGFEYAIEKLKELD